MKTKTLPGTQTAITPFQSALSEAIIAKIKEMRRAGDTGASIGCLKQCVNLPMSARSLPGAPQGANAPYLYSRIFTATCAFLPAKYNDFIL